LSSFGEELRKQREIRQITLQEIAETTKVNVRFLEALERNDFDALPRGLFTRGFIRAYSGHVGLDPDAMVNAYLYEIGQARTEEDPRAHHNPDLPRLQRQRAASPRRWSPAWILAAVAALLTAALLWFVVLAGDDDGAGKEDEMEPQTARAQETAAATQQMLEIFALGAVNLRVACGAVDLLERRVEKDERLTFLCDAAFRLHAPRADSLQVRLNGEPIAPPASPLSGWNPAEGTP
jgi:transcriptional regulator with XRE-family HTH domain